MSPGLINPQLAEAKRLIELWKRRMGLLEWDVVPYVHSAEDSTAMRGSIFWDIQTLQARMGITLLDLWGENEIGVANLEWVVVHELLHLVFHGVEPAKKHMNDFFEQGINRTAKALIKAYS